MLRKVEVMDERAVSACRHTVKVLPLRTVLGRAAFDELFFGLILQKVDYH